MNYAVIMAGGSGKRLWPLSRRKRPKQVLKLIEGQTLLGICFDRLRPTFDPEHILVLTNVAFADIVRETLPELPAENVIAEPAIRDTSAAIGLAATVLAARDEEATMAMITADHVIRPKDVFQQVIRDAMAFVDDHQDHLVTFGIKPTYASTQFGYLRCTDPASLSGIHNPVYTVEAFSEKPDSRTAQQYLDDGRYFWNSGLFAWRARTILNCLQQFLPDAMEPLAQIRAAWDSPQRQSVLDEWFVKIPKISIDFSVMEKAPHVSALPMNCSWLDLGAFNALTDVIEPDDDQNVVSAKTHELLDCTNNIIVTEQDGHLIAAIGLKGMVVAHSEDATLICPADQTGRLKELLAAIEANRKEQYL